MMKVFKGLDELGAAGGTDLGATAWVTVEQDRIDGFADVTGDHQWIHVDTERAADGPFGGTIAHGFLTLSLLPVFLGSLYRVEGTRMAVNVGLNKVRFLNAVPVGSRLRAVASIPSTTVLEGAVQVVFNTTIEIDGSEKPAAIAESIIRYLS